MCHSVHRGGGLHPGVGQTTPSPQSDTMVYDQRVGGTHPTGMHSCMSMFLEQIPSQLTVRRERYTSANLSQVHTRRQARTYIYVKTREEAIMSQTSEVHPSMYRQKNVPLSVQMFPARKNPKYLTLLAKLNKYCVSNLSIRVVTTTQ